MKPSILVTCVFAAVLASCTTTTTNPAEEKGFAKVRLKGMVQKRLFSGNTRTTNWPMGPTLQKLGHKPRSPSQHDF